MKLRTSTLNMSLLIFKIANRQLPTENPGNAKTTNFASPQIDEPLPIRLKAN
ncbi:MAG: hypothetical protein M2R45_01206 [Verrucomicrobia subdivision 3 bacterium]|nr:hypothetical protein [Limisphaerales bacterium]MCS1415242.1 hypothetical protein [Limisphaerales bacterium]